MSREPLYAEMEEALGLVPSFFARMPDATVEFKWKLFRDFDENSEIVLHDRRFSAGALPIEI